ncbi:LamG domain-containing protein [Candidatus Bathyarchaeota archaeon]|nr:LamG domain-containing protein [Candidatus Bathyarchaeota archaeon]
MAEGAGATPHRDHEEGRLTPTPSWAQCHVEIYEEPGFLDDCFRSSLWTKFQSAASESFVNAGDVSGDYAVMTVTEGGAVNGAGWMRDISGLSLDTDEYPLIRTRLRGRGTTPQYKVEVEYTDASSTTSGWTDAPSGFEPKMLQLAAGKTVKYVKLYARSDTPNQTAMIDYDYAAVLRNPPLIPGEMLEFVADLVTTSAVSGLRLAMLNDPLLGVTERRYSLDENLGTKAYDLSRNRHRSGIVNATWNSGGVYGYCLYFLAASSCRLDTGYTATVAATAALSIAFWVKASPGASGVVCGFGKTIGADWNRIQFNWSSDKLRLYVKDDAANVRQYTSSKTVADGDWHHVIGVINPANDETELYVDGTLDGGASGTLGAITLDAHDLTFGCVHTGGGYSSYTTCYVDEPLVASRALTAEEAYRLSVENPLSGAARVGAGNIVMAYLGAESEALVTKLITARVIDRVTLGEPDRPVVQLICEDLGEILHERTFTKEYVSATQISGIVDDVMDQSGAEFYQDKDTTNRSIVNKFNAEGVWALLEKLAEAATFASGETGANFYVDPGGALRFKRYGAFSCGEAVSDGGDGNAANILDIQVKESIKGSPRLVNDVKVIVFEAEYSPADQDALTESAEAWSSPDPTDSGYPQSDSGDKVAGTASIKYQFTGAGTVYRMRLNFSDMDLTGFDRIVFYLKHGATVNVDDFSVKLWRNSIWVTDYYEKTGVSPGAAATWVEYTVDISDFTKTGNPGPIIDTVQIKVNHSSGIGTGGALVDKLRFIRDEKSGADSDSTSQTAYGKRTLRLVDKTITDVDYAGYVAGNIVAHRKDPLVTAQVNVPGRGQLGYRPPMLVTLTSLKDGVDGESFQIVRAVHRYTPGSGYTCVLDLVAARQSDGSYEPRIAPAVGDVGISLAVKMRMLSEGSLNALRSVWI